MGAPRSRRRPSAPTWRSRGSKARIPRARRARSLSPRSAARLIAANPQDWRARLALARHSPPQGRPREALELLFEALVHNPHALALHQAIWQTLSQLQPAARARRPLRRAHARRVFYLDPHVCVRCRYRSTELLWQCPHCHEWNTFVEERIAPAKETR